MARPTKRKEERRLLKEIRRDLPNVTAWTLERHAKVDDVLRGIMLLAFEGDQADFLLGMDALQLYIDVEGIRQEWELAERRAEWMKQVSVSIRILDIATGKTLDERVVRAAIADSPPAVS